MKSEGTVWTWMDTMKVRYMVDSKPVLNSEHLGWKHIQFSKWNKIAPQEAYVESMPNYLITMHTSPEPLKTLTLFEGREYERVMKTGEISCYVPGNFDYFRWENIEASYICMMLSPSLVDRVASQADVTFKGSDEITNKLSVYDPKLVQLSKWLADEVYSNGARGTLYIESLSNLLALHLLEIFSKPNKELYVPRTLSDQQLSRVIEYMNTYYERDISLEQLAAVAGLSQTHLVRMFKQTTGMSPYQYFIRLRIEKVKVLIASREYTLGEIALILGFTDQSHMNRQFKRITGLTPKEYMMSI